MVLVPVHRVEAVTLQLRWSVLGLSDWASVDGAVALIDHLERVGVDKRHKSMVIDKDVRLVDVADNVVATMHGIYCSRDVDGYRTEVPIGEMRKVSPSGRGVVALAHRLHGAYPVHQEPDGVVRSGGQSAVQRIQRPRYGYVAPALGHCGWIVHHQRQLGADRPARTVVDLRYKIRELVKSVDRPLAPGAEQVLVAYGQRLPVGTAIQYTWSGALHPVTP